MRLRILKILIFIFSAFLLYKSLNFGNSKNIANCWSNQFSISKGDELTIYINPIKKLKKSFLVIYNINDQAVDSVEADLSNPSTIIEEEWLNGQNYSAKINYHCNLEPGLYHLEQNFSFCVKNPNAEIQIVIPHLYQLCSSNSTGTSFYSPLNTKTKNTSLINPENNIPFVLNYSKSTLKIASLNSVYSFFKINYPNKTIGFISDLDLKQLKNPPLLVFVGNYSFMESSTALYLNQLVKNGSNLLIASSTIMNNKVRIDKAKQQITFYGLSGLDPVKDSISSATRFNDSISTIKNYQLIGMDYQFADKPLTNYFKFCNKNDSILIKAPYFNGIPLNSNCTANLQLIGFDKAEIIATAPCKYKEKTGFGTIGVLYNGKGKIVQLPAEEWFTKQNLNDSAIKNLTLELLAKVIAN